jgi:hypothetical protein
VTNTDHTCVLFLDAVGYSQKPADEQNAFIQALHAACETWEPFTTARARNSATFHNSGDGFALCFFDDLFAPLACARLLSQTNLPLPVRMGIHRGIVERGHKDPNRNEQHTGEGINIAARVMDKAIAGQILLSAEYATDLRSATKEHNLYLHDLGASEVKHRVVVSLVNYYDGDAGIPPPGIVLPLTGKNVALLYRRHAKHDEHVLAVLERGLKIAGATVFVDKQIPVGTEWKTHIREKVETSDACIPLLSEHSQYSEMLEEEIKIAHNAAAKSGNPSGNNGKPRLLPVRVGYEGTLIEPLAAILDPLQYFLWQNDTDDATLVAELTNALLAPPPVPKDAPLGPLGSGTGAIALDSPYYMERTADPRLADAITRKEGLIRIKGSRQVGKTSLLNRALHNAGGGEGIAVVRTDYQAFTEAELADLPTFYKALGRKLSRALRSTVPTLPDIASVWDDTFSPNDNLQDYLELHVLDSLPGSLLWGMDEVDRLFVTPFRSDVFGLFRSWYNLRNASPDHPLCRLTLLLSYATEAALFITDLNQSPFNVGVDIPLSDFTPSEIAELNRRFGSLLRSEDEIARFIAQVGGHPFLAHRALIEIVRHGMSLAQFEAEADTDTGLFGDHLRRILFSTSDELTKVLRDATAGKPCADDREFTRLCEAGVLMGNYRAPQFRCGIYKNYLTRHLNT